MVKISAIRGFKDILPHEAPLWQYIEDTARRVFANYGFKEIRVPIMEKTELFSRGIGETTDIVEKEMYTFLDRGEESLTLRPEATASIVRAILEHHLHIANPILKLFTIGPMFRRERPQKGRLRQFHQIDAEVLGTEDPRIDGEVIVMLMHFLREVGLKQITLEINSLGCPACRQNFREAVQSYLQSRTSSLCPDCNRRLQVNPLRVFDCKVELCKESLKEAPLITDFLCLPCRHHFQHLQESLMICEIPFVVNPKMVRGLDYYTRTAFEVTTDELGAQNAVAGGGRYDGLSEELGGPHIPGIGFAIGCERLLSLLPETSTVNNTKLEVFIVPLGEEAQKLAFQLSHRLRLRDIKTDMGSGDKSLKWQLKQADRVGARFCLLLGENELKSGQYILRDMEKGNQKLIPAAELEETIANTLRSERH